PLGRKRVEQTAADALRQSEGQGRARGNDRERLTELAGEEGRQIFRMLNEGKVAAAGLSHAREERLIDPATETKRAGRNSGLALAGDLPGILLRIDQADIGQAIGQQDRAAKATGCTEL